MKTKIYLCIAVGLVLFLLGGFVMNQVVTAQVKMKPSPMPTTRIMWDYDSGWVDISTGQALVFPHNLGGDPGKYFVYVFGYWASNEYYHQHHYGCNDYHNADRGLYWQQLTDTDISVYRFPDDNSWDRVCVRILKNQ